MLVSALPEFGDRHPAIQIHLREAEGEDQLLAIARGEVDLVVCRRPAIVPEGWEFHPVREDQLVVVCRAGHPLACSDAVSTAELAKQTWLLMPAGLAARTHFDEFSTRLPTTPRAYPVVTRSLPMLWRLLLRQPLLALLPRNLATPLLSAGELVELRVGHTAGMEPIGVLQRQTDTSEATYRLSNFLRSFSQAP